MAMPILTTKLYIPPSRQRVVVRPRLSEQLNEILRRKLTLISAPAGFGKTTLVSEWCHQQQAPIAWLSLSTQDSDPARFLLYVIAALQTVFPQFGQGLVTVLQSPQPPSIEAFLILLLNEIVALPNDFVLVLDDYHVIDAQAVDDALAFLLERMPPQMHLTLATREDPSLPLAQLRVRDQLTELRAADLRFTSAESAEFLNRTMSLNLSAQNIAALETRTEGWIAGLQLAALAMSSNRTMQGQTDADSFIESFTGSHRFVLDYLIQEVLQQQPEGIQNFLLRTSILDHMCGALCDAVVCDAHVPGQQTLVAFEHANLFVVPLDNERRWYRYHHLFAELLHQRLRQNTDKPGVTELHIRASQWLEVNGLVLEAFHHATEANDIARAARLMECDAMPLHLPGTKSAILNWLELLPRAVLNAQPALWFKQAELLLNMGQTTNIEEKLAATEAALAAIAQPSSEMDDQTRNLIGKIASIRSNVALLHYHAETILVQARRALDYLNPNALAYRSSVTRDMGFAYSLQGNRAAAGRTFAEAFSIGQASGEPVGSLLATIGLAEIQVLENQLYAAAENYQRILPQIKVYSLLNAGPVCLGLAWIYYEWNDLDAAEQYGEQSLKMGQQYDQIIHRFIASWVFLARLKLARGDRSSASALLTQAEHAARQHNFMHLLPHVVTVQVLLLLCQNDLATAAELAERYELPLSQARVLLVQEKPSAALSVLAPYLEQMRAKNWQDEQLKALVLQSLALYAKHETDKARQALGEALKIAEPGGLIRTFVDEGPLMAELLTRMTQMDGTSVAKLAYIHTLLAAFDDKPSTHPSAHSSQSLAEPLSQREGEILRLIAEGCSNREIGERLYLALDTVKGHNRRIFEKLQVQRRTEAIARARDLGLL